MNYEKHTCKLCGDTFTGEYSKARAEECERGHDVITISIMDYELPGLINFFNTNDRSLLPKGFLKKLRNLQGRVLRG